MNVIRFTSSKGETFHGLILETRGDMAHVFWDKMRHPVLKPLKVISNCSIPHEREPEINWTTLTGQLPNTKIEILSDVSIQWECGDIVKVITSGLDSIDIRKYSMANIAKYTEKDLKKRQAFAAVAPRDGTEAINDPVEN